MEGVTLWGQFALQLIEGKWMMVVASFYIKAFAGANTVFGIYSIPIKASLNYDQTTIGTLGFFKDLGANLGIFAGLLSEVLRPWIVLAIGAAINLFGYLMIWLAVTHRIPPPPLWQMYLFMCIGADSIAFTGTAVSITSLKNFPHSRGVILGFNQGFTSISGAIFTQLYSSLHYANGNISQDILLFVACLPCAINILFMFFIRTMKGGNLSIEDARKEKKHWYSFLYIALILAAFLMIVLLLQNQIALSSSAHKLTTSVTIFLVVSNIVVAIKAEREKMKRLQEEQAEKLATSEENTIASVEALGEENVDSIDNNPKESSEMSSNEGPVQPAKPNINETFLYRAKMFLKRIKPACAIKGAKRGDDFTIPQALLSLDMWLLLIASICGIGSSLAAMDNMGQIGESLGYSRESISTLVGLLSIWNFLGRMLGGFASEALMKKKGTPRTLFFTIFLVLGCGGHLLIAFPKKGSLYGACVIEGLSYGGQRVLLSVIISELFGLKYFATLINVGALAIPLGSYVLNVRVAGYLYDRQASLQQEVEEATAAGGRLTCLGSHCFASAFLIMTCVALFGSLVSALLLLRTFSFYRNAWQSQT